MSEHIKQSSLMILAFFTLLLAGCGGGGGGSSSAATDQITTPLICKLPETINDDGNACEFIASPCNYPEVANEDLVCVMDQNEWIPGANNIEMPTPEYTAAPGEVVFYYALTNGEYDGWGLHAWNNADCNSYADFTRPDGGTEWNAPIQPTGIDPNFGAYWVMNIIDQPNCANFIPHNLDLNEQTEDLLVKLNNATVNPTGNFYVLEGFEQFRFPWPRTFASLVVPGGSTLVCPAGQVPNDAGTECINDPTEIAVFVPGEAELFLRGDFNGWNAEAAYGFSYADNVYTMVAHLPAAAEGYNFKVADANFSEATSFGALASESVVTLGEGKTLVVTEGENITIEVPVEANYQFTFDATDPAAPVLTVVEVVYDKLMFVKGTMNDWSNTNAMSYLGNHIYSLQLSLTAQEYEFKVADADWTENTNFGAGEGDENLTLDVAKSLVFGEGIALNIKLNITEAANYHFVIDATIPEAPILTVSNAIPFGSSVLYLKGEMNGWGGDGLAGYDFSYADNHYTLITQVAAGPLQFKIADENWSQEATLGVPEGDEGITLGQPKVLTLVDEANMSFTFAANTFYQFDVDATNKNAPILTITEYALFGGNSLYLKGSMNGWTAEAPYLFSVEGTTYRLETTLAAGNYEFKIADPDWADISNLGAFPDLGAVVLGESKALMIGGTSGNLTLSTTEEKTYIFTIDASLALAPSLSVVEKP